MSIVYLRLRTNDGKLYRVNRAVVPPMRTIWEMLTMETCDSNEVIPLPNIDSSTLKLLIRWCEAQMFFTEDTDISVAVGILRGLTRDEDTVLFELLMAANYLQLYSLVEVGTQLLANIIHSCNNVEELRLRFNIKKEGE